MQQSCPVNNSIRAIDAAGNVTCESDSNSGGDMTAVNTPAGSGLSGGVATGAATLTLLTTCAASQILKWSTRRRPHPGRSRRRRS